MQISEELFIALLKYHLVEIDDVLPEIKKGLEEKLEAMVRRDLYTKYKTAPTEEEREKRQDRSIWRRWECTGAFDGKFFLQCVRRERATLLYIAVKEKVVLGCNDKIGLHSQAPGV